MLLAGTFGVGIGGPISLLICEGGLPDDAWQAMVALAGSWIGGGANFRGSVHPIPSNDACRSTGCVTR